MSEIGIDGIFDRFAAPDYPDPENGQISASLRQRRRTIMHEGSTLAGEETAQPICIGDFCDCVHGPLRCRQEKLTPSM
ncbi:hypothetical protein [Mesorhizobium sp.]|uniref:hypothetical protein n=1 Tax=Mesorhizobium sp. TaxID=1871066 RepID=UPI00257E4A3D|nr:hypothetical protein [Mesorhizobium sp.]